LKTGGSKIQHCLSLLSFQTSSFGMFRGECGQLDHTLTLEVGHESRATLHTYTSVNFKSSTCSMVNVAIAKHSWCPFTIWEFKSLPSKITIFW
jgi:hypothetical protein